jgi:hypothetical protein
MHHRLRMHLCIAPDRAAHRPFSDTPAGLHIVACAAHRPRRRVSSAHRRPCIGARVQCVGVDASARVCTGETAPVWQKRGEAVGVGIHSLANPHFMPKRKPASHRIPTNNPHHYQYAWSIKTHIPPGARYLMGYSVCPDGA